MIRLALAALIVITSANPVCAMWQLYKEDKGVIASFDYDSFAPVNGNPSAWVRWQYATPQNDIGGREIQFTADCSNHKLYEIATNPYDADGNYLASNENLDPPKEFPVTPGSLNGATYDLLCRGGK